MTDATPTFDRRRLLAGTGLATAGLAGASLLGATEAAAHTSSLTAVNVRDHGALGDGVADDRGAIQSALDHFTSSGGMVFFPAGKYKVGGPLVPRSNTLMVGCNAAAFDSSFDPAGAACKIFCASGFSGSGLLAPASGSYGITIKDLALAGANVGSGIHGIRLPDYAPNREFALTLEGVTINGFSGDGIHGHLHVGVLNNCHIARNQGWGVNASGGNAWLDVFACNCFLYFNLVGNLYFGGARASGMVEFANCRFERAGGNPSNPGAPYGPTAPGVRLASAERIGFVNCATDANMGNGVEVIHESGTPDYYPRHVRFANCIFSRDGTGNQVTLQDYAGLMVKGQGSTDPVKAQRISATNCHVTYGKADDGGSGTVIGPKYGVWYEKTTHFHWLGGHVAVNSVNNSFYPGPNPAENWRPMLVAAEHSVLALPLAQPSVDTPDGCIYVDAAGSRLRVKVNGGWKSAPLV